MNDRSAPSLLLGFVLGRVPEALAEARLAQQLDPRSATVFTDGAFLYYLLRVYDEAIAAGRKAIDIEPTLGLAYAQLGLTYAAVGRNSEAHAAAETGSRVDDSPWCSQTSARCTHTSERKIRPDKS